MTDKLAVKTNVWSIYMGNVFEALCYCCNVNKITALNFAVGHVIADARGGDYVVENLRPICTGCNSSMKHTHMLDYMIENNLNESRWHEFKKCDRDLISVYQKKIAKFQERLDLMLKIERAEIREHGCAVFEMAARKARARLQKKAAPASNAPASNAPVTRSRTSASSSSASSSSAPASASRIVAQDPNEVPMVWSEFESAVSARIDRGVCCVPTKKNGCIKFCDRACKRKMKLTGGVNDIHIIICSRHYSMDGRAEDKIYKALSSIEDDQ